MTLRIYSATVKAIKRSGIVAKVLRFSCRTLAMLDKTAADVQVEMIISECIIIVDRVHRGREQVEFI